MKPESGMRRHDINTPAAYIWLQIDIPDGKPFSESLEELVKNRFFAYGAMKKETEFLRCLDGQKEISDAMIKFTN